MQWKNTNSNYGLAIKLCHHSVALLMILQIILGIGHEYVSKPLSSQFMMLRLLLIPFALLFILLRFANYKPEWPTSMPSSERYLAHFVHTSLYSLILLMPISGWLMSSAAGYTQAPSICRILAMRFC